MRGKHRQASSGRTLAALNAAIAAAQAELADEQILLDEAAAEQQRIDERRAYAQHLNTTRDEVTAAESSALAAEAELLRDLVRQSEHQFELIYSRWDTAIGEVIAHLGGGIHGMEGFMELMTGRRVPVVWDKVPGLSRERVQQLEFARGERKIMSGEAGPLSTGRFLDAILPPHLGRAESDDESAETELDPKVASAAWTTVEADVVAVWHPMPWLADTMRVDPDAIARQLGVMACETSAASRPVDAEQASALPTPALSSARRASLASSPAAEAITAWAGELSRTGRIAVESRINAPYSPMPPHATPSEAASIKHWYSMAALGSWLRAEAYERGPVDRYGQIAVAAMAAPVFWLPPAQTFDFLDSEPLTKAT